jgi:hypothetical protein
VSCVCITPDVYHFCSVRRHHPTFFLSLIISIKKFPSFVSFVLLRRLRHPSSNKYGMHHCNFYLPHFLLLGSSHKDRIRRLNKFRNYVTGESTAGTPEFYDDDIPILLLGSAAPAALLAGSDLLEDIRNGPDGEGGGGGGSSIIYGLLQACGTPSAEHDHMLKRSARHAMALLKFLVIDFIEEGDSSGPNKLNLFAQAFCSFPQDKYRYMSLDLHLIGDQRGGAQEDACEVMILLLTKHLQEDGETLDPLSKEDLLASQQAHQAFDSWVAKHATKSQQELIKMNGQKRKEILKNENKKASLSSEFRTGDEGERSEEFGDSDNDSDDDNSDKKAHKKDMLEAEKYEEISGPALRWEDSQLYREQQARMAAQERLASTSATTQVGSGSGSGGSGSGGGSGGEYTVRDSQEAAAELAEREEEKSKILRKDPLGLHGTEFDLRAMEMDQVDHLEQALSELQEELKKAESGVGGIEDDQALRAKKESLETVLDGIIGVTGVIVPAKEQHQQLNDNNQSNGINNVDTGKSILPTDGSFDPIIFLTLVHRKASYEELVGSMNRLTSK